MTDPSIRAPSKRPSGVNIGRLNITPGGLIGLLGIFVILVVVVAYQAGSSKPDVEFGSKTAVSSWSAQNLHFMDALSSDTQAMVTASSVPGNAAINGACSTMAGDSAAALAAAPIPDATLNASWRGFLSTYAQSAKLCLEGTRPGGDSDRVVEAAGVIQDAARQLSQFNTALAHFRQS